MSERSDSEETAVADPPAPTPAYAPVERASVRDLLQQPRVRRLGTRAVVALVAAVVVGFLAADWRVGVTAGIVAAIGEAVYRARSHSSVPAWRRASAAERRTEAQLRSLQRNGYRTLHARAIPDSEAQIDHLVVGPTGVYAVDSEKWDRRLPVRVQSGKKLFHGPFDMKPRLTEAKWEATRAGELISARYGREITVVPSLAVYGPPVPWKIMTIRGVDVYQGDRARKWITKRERALTQEEIDRIYEIAAEVLPPRYGEG
ncbi:nuclease-related domain-containing protein [Nonomuraea pusilla]|uniref:Nuclease-related domain-containing protein n=1 Tax=Nonomuraea pusilla TaxID=46177 RepID=A0A1H8GT76_9ACTN|nr:nuclease-related domain-containing protein [Nonomuraea pusilla]SEN46999.1 Nuclease-related domain-containing protein [Nonomuraea pusilla]